MVWSLNLFWFDAIPSIFKLPGVFPSPAALLRAWSLTLRTHSVLFGHTLNEVPLRISGRHPLRSTPFSHPACKFLSPQPASCSSSVFWAQGLSCSPWAPPPWARLQWMLLAETVPMVKFTLFAFILRGVTFCTVCYPMNKMIVPYISFKFLFI